MTSMLQLDGSVKLNYWLLGYWVVGLLPINPYPSLVSYVCVSTGCGLVVWSLGLLKSGHGFEAPLGELDCKAQSLLPSNHWLNSLCGYLGISLEAEQPLRKFICNKVGRSEIP